MKTDFLVMTCDIVTDIPIHLVADLHRINDATMTCMLKSSRRTAEEEDTKKKGQEKAKPQRDDVGQLDVIAMAAKERRLLYMTAIADVDDFVTLPKRMLRKCFPVCPCNARRYPDVVVSTDLMDAHFYFFSHKILALLESKPELESIKGDVVPWLLRRQFATAPQTCALFFFVVYSCQGSAWTLPFDVSPTLSRPALATEPHQYHHLEK